MFSDAEIGAMSIKVDRQLAAARVMPIADEKDAIDELRRLRSQLRVLGLWKHGFNGIREAR